MKNYYSYFLLSLFAAFFCFSELPAQTTGNVPSPVLYNTKRNFVFLNASTGGGDYPFFGMGLTLSRQFFNRRTMAGFSFQYIGNTHDGSDIGGIDPIQIFPLTLDIRQMFTESKDGRFATFIIANAGYVVSITGDGEDSDGPFEFGNGWAVNPGFAFRFNAFENVGLMADITWLHHDSPREWKSPVIKKDRKHWDVILLRGNVFF
jgi:hypothetical protein